MESDKHPSYILLFYFILLFRYFLNLYSLQKFTIERYLKLFFLSKWRKSCIWILVEVFLSSCVRFHTTSSTLPLWDPFEVSCVGLCCTRVMNYKMKNINHTYIFLNLLPEQDLNFEALIYLTIGRILKMCVWNGQSYKFCVLDKIHRI